MSDQQALTRDLWPHTWQWDNYVDVLRHPGLPDLVAQHAHVRGARHRAHACCRRIPVAYALAKFRFRGRNLALMLVIATMMLPPQVVDRAAVPVLGQAAAT